MTAQNQKTSTVPMGPLDDLVDDLDAAQLKGLVRHLFSSTKSLSFRATIKSWRKNQKLPQAAAVVPVGPLDDLVDDLDAVQLKPLVRHLFSSTKSLSFRASIKSWRKSQKLPQTV
jgi:hypothetical protein